MDSANAADAPSSRFTSGRILHLTIGGCLLAANAAFVYLRTVAGLIPLSAEAGVMQLLAYGMAAVSIAQMSVALLVLKPRVPQRMLGQSLDEYWTGTVASKSLVVWAVLEAAGMVAGTGYLLTGAIVPAIVAGVAIVLYAITGPGSFAKG